MKPFLPPLTKEEEAYYISKFREGDKKAKDKLVSHNLRLVAHIAKKYNCKPLEMTIAQYNEIYNGYKNLANNNVKK